MPERYYRNAERGGSEPVGALPQWWIDIFKSRIRITDVALALDINNIRTRRGSYYASSPFQSGDDDPSMHLRDQEEAFFDFATGASGDAVQLVQDVRRCTVGEAIEFLHTRFASEIPYPHHKETREEYEQRLRSIEQRQERRRVNRRKRKKRTGGE